MDEVCLVSMLNTEFNLEGKIALVTGASSGLGAHFCKILAERGAKVIVTGRREDKIKNVVSEIRKKKGEAISIPLDVTDNNSIKWCFDKVENTYGVVDIVSNNAGVAKPEKALSVDEESWDKVIDTNLKGVWLVSTEAARRMILKEVNGSIVNTSSIQGFRVAMDRASYAASKAAVIQLTKALALEWSEHKIRVNALCPGFFFTEMTENYFTSPKFSKYLSSLVPKRIGNIDEITAPFLLLASNAGSYVNGISIPVDGGHSLGKM